MGIDILTLAAAMAGKGGGSASKYKQPEWGADTAIVDILPETELTILEEVGAAMVMQEVTLTEGNVYTVKFNGTEYACTAISNSSTGLLLGNAGAIDETFPVTSEPFIFMAIPEEQREQYMGAYAIVVPLDGSTSFTLSIKNTTGEIHKIPAEYTELSPLIVNLIVEGTTGKMDVAFADIMKAIRAGKNVYVNNGTFMYPLNYIRDDEITFGGFYHDDTDTRVRFYRLLADETLSYHDVAFRAV